MTITLQAGVYDFSTVIWTENQYVTAGSGTAALWLHSVGGLTLQAESGADVELVTPDLFSEVMMFTNCNGITLSGIKAGHSVTDKYQCDAGVLRFDNSANITIDNCLFYGCGAVGIRLWDCINAKISDTTVTDCSLRAVDLSRSEYMVFTGCSFIDNRAYGCVIMGNDSYAEFVDCDISGNRSLEWSCVEFTGQVLFDRCVFRNNALVAGSDTVFAGSEITLRDCEIEKNNFSAYWNYGVIDLGGNLLR
jgi:parallel beta-helix repeat protein